MKDCFLFLCYPDTWMKEQMLRESINKAYGLAPIAVATHLPLPKDILEKIDYHIYDSNDCPSSNYNWFYHYNTDDLHIRTANSTPYHGLSCLNSMWNGAALLKNFDRVHFFEYDVLADFEKYRDFVNALIPPWKFVGCEYDVVLQSLKGVVTGFFSFDPKWFCKHVERFDSWAEFSRSGRDGNDNLMLENWLHNRFVDRGAYPDCRWLRPEESSSLIINDNIQTPGNKEPGLRAYISELEDHRIILFVHLYGRDRHLRVSVKINESIEEVDIPGGVVCWWVTNKVGFIEVKSELQEIWFDIDPFEEYTRTVFKFDDGRFRCLKSY